MKYLVVFIINLGLCFQLSAQDAVYASGGDSGFPPKPQFEIHISIDSDASFKGASDGMATASVPGEKEGQYTYEWLTTPVQYGRTATGLSSGMYLVTATDKQGRTSTEAVTIVNRKNNSLQKDFSQVSVFPNPSTGEFHINLEGHFQQDVQMTVRNLIGQVMRQASFEAFSREHINLQDLPKGTYILSLEWKDLTDRYSTRIIIQ